MADSHDFPCNGAAAAKIRTISVMIMIGHLPPAHKTIPWKFVCLLSKPINWQFSFNHLLAL